MKAGLWNILSDVRTSSSKFGHMREQARAADDSAEPRRRPPWVTRIQTPTCCPHPALMHAPLLRLCSLVATCACGWDERLPITPPPTNPLHPSREEKGGGTEDLHVPRAKVLGKKATAERERRQTQSGRPGERRREAEKKGRRTPWSAEETHCPAYCFATCTANTQCKSRPGPYLLCSVRGPLQIGG